VTLNKPSQTNVILTKIQWLPNAVARAPPPVVPGDDRFKPPAQWCAGDHILRTPAAPSTARPAVSAASPKDWDSCGGGGLEVVVIRWATGRSCRYKATESRQVSARRLRITVGRESCRLQIPRTKKSDSGDPWELAASYSAANTPSGALRLKGRRGTDSAQPSCIDAATPSLTTHGIARDYCRADSRANRVTSVAVGAHAAVAAHRPRGNEHVCTGPRVKWIEPQRILLCNACSKSSPSIANTSLKV
jgi:hypothetical protein